MDAMSKLGSSACILLALVSALPPAAGATDPFACIFTDKGGKPLRGVETRLSAIHEGELAGFEPLFRKSDEDGSVEYPPLLLGQYVLEAQLRGYVSVKTTVTASVVPPLRRVLLRAGEFERVERRALKAIEQGDFESAIAGLETLLEHYPEDALLYDALSRAHSGLNDLDEALTAARLAQQHDPDRFPDAERSVQKAILARQGEEALQAYEFETAESIFTELQAIAPEEPVAYEGLSIALGHQGKLARARESIRKAIELDPDNPQLVEIRKVLERAGGGE